MKTTNKKRILKESEATLEVAIAKCLGQSRLHPSEIEEVATLTIEELMANHGLDHLLAEKVKVHIQTEMQRQGNQSLMTWDVDSREPSGGSLTRSYPIPESASKKDFTLNELHDFELEDITDFEDKTDMIPSEDHADTDEGSGKMLDYGHVKSDSREGKMMKQALYEIAEYSKELHDMLDEDDDLPQWCHYKVAVARSCIGKVKHYLEYKIKKHTGEIQ